MVTEISRRGFLRGAIERKSTVPMRPPGAVAQLFESLCEDCNACQVACPETVIAPDAEGRPVLDFSQSYCTFCGVCADVCPTGAIKESENQQTHWRAKMESACWSMNAVACRMCQDTCPESAIRFQLKLGGCAEPSIDHDLCTGCGACSTVCPASAVTFHSVSENYQEEVA